MSNPLELFRKKRSDLSNFLIHLTKNGSIETWRPYPRQDGHFLYDSKTEVVRAEDSLKSILTSTPPTLRARSPFGVFKLLGINVGRIQKLNVTPNDLASVCFSETPLRELPSFYRSTQDKASQNVKTNKYQKFGLAFETSYIRRQGGHPVFYYDRGNPPVRSSIERLGQPDLRSIAGPMLHLCEPYGPKINDDSKEIDFRWEREWRVKGDFTFALTNVAFGICPKERIKEFEELVSNHFPFIDPDQNFEDIKQDLETRGWTGLASKF